MSRGTLGKQDIETLREFSQVPPEQSNNPIYHRHYEAAMASIRELIREKDAEYAANKRSNRCWHETPTGKTVQAILVAVLVLVIIAFLKHWFPFLK